MHTEKTYRNATDPEWDGLANKSRDPAAFLRGEIPCYEDAAGLHRILPPGAAIERAAPTQHEYPATPAPADAPTNASDDIVAALRSEAQVSDEASALAAIEEALYTVNRAAPTTAITPRAAVVAAADDAILDEITRLGGGVR